MPTPLRTQICRTNELILTTGLSNLDRRAPNYGVRRVPAPLWAGAKRSEDAAHSKVYFLARRRVWRRNYRHKCAKPLNFCLTIRPPGNIQQTPQTRLAAILHSNANYRKTRSDPGRFVQMYDDEGLLPKSP